MKTRSITWLFMLTASIFIHARHPFLLHEGRYLAFAAAILFGSFIIPGVVFPMLLDLLHQDPFSRFHHDGTIICMVLISGLFWWYIGDRGRRIAGTFDAFEKSERRSGGLTRAFAKLRDMYDRRRFGREKTGGWA